MSTSNAGEEISAPNNWWRSDGGFFGHDYMRGDDSREGFLAGEALSLTERTVREVDGVIRLTGVAPGDKLLDCPCGYGRHSLELARRGVNVIGQDINLDHLSAARAEAARHKAEGKVVFETRDMRDVGHAQSFDAIINMFYSYGFFASDEENFQVLKSWHAALKPGGRLLIHTDVNVPRIATGSYKLSEVRSLKSGGQLKITEDYSTSTHRINGTWEVSEHGENVKLTPYSMRVFTAGELTGWLKKAGFKQVNVFSTWSGQAYSEDSEEMIVVAGRGDFPTNPG